MTTTEPSMTHIERRAKRLLLLMAALVAGFVLYVMVARGVFESTQQLVLISDDSEGVIVGMDLTFSGFPIGRVRRIELAPDGMARMVIDVPHKQAHWLRSSSIFTLERGMVGDTRIRAYSGILSDPPLPPDSERTLLRGDTSAEVPRLVASARALLENLEAMTGTESPLNASLGQLKTTTERMNGRYGVLTGVMGSDNNAKQIIQTLERTNSLLAKTEQRMFGSGGLADTTQATLSSGKVALDQLHNVLSDTRNTLKNVDAVLAEAQAVGVNARIASTDLGALRAEVEASLRRLSQLTDEINRKWPFARDTEIKLP
ncbi:MlaD family protein [Rhodoferax sp.]|uniref:MlaD family protein n=1 Tax=Rhodoferax sp. TaxID=50421 RepID=UPI0008D88B3E|nr:mammalian cell entry protein [Rhodoferax sp.]OGB39403.1 MAG: mammalian cell entry protein [Burkholderiales bacterium RIFOXYC2_FULL_59_8]OGB59737.1 MAG: mammalian cell entry protein [Burkholderiales bacterium RIFOXYD12_FULL_59_19]OGB82098.1 MAG: mammalian cell entry protein [Burkholderiales bacterium RIFOXYD2_FULL_59_8]MDO8320373.1 mammalian cell entry protein [Rhodoferax sp.]MDP2677424.1 mammalian cell entry protein [Rhodoferax sp.]